MWWGWDGKESRGGVREVWYGDGESFRGGGDVQFRMLVINKFSYLQFTIPL